MSEWYLVLLLLKKEKDQKAIKKKNWKSSMWQIQKVQESLLI